MYWKAGHQDPEQPVLSDPSLNAESSIKQSQRKPLLVALLIDIRFCRVCRQSLIPMLPLCTVALAHKLDDENAGKLQHRNPTHDTEAHRELGGVFSDVEDQNYERLAA